MFRLKKKEIEEIGFMESQPATEPVKLIDFYSIPFRVLGKYSWWYYDNKSNFVFQLEPKYVGPEQHTCPGFIETTKQLLESINNFDHKPMEGDWQVLNTGIELTYNGEHVMTIRGWGNLTGTGAHNLSSERAREIQDNFVDWFMWKVANKKVIRKPKTEANDSE